MSCAHAGVGEQVRLCRVENFVKHHEAWSEMALGFVQDVVSQAFREPALLFKDKINFKGPGGGAFLAYRSLSHASSSRLSRTNTRPDASSSLTSCTRCFRAIPTYSQFKSLYTRSPVVSAM